MIWSVGALFHDGTVSGSSGTVDIYIYIYIFVPAKPISDSPGPLPKIMAQDLEKCRA